jgi:transposase InsO family protein
VWRVLRRHGLNTRAKRYGLVAGYAAPPEPQRPAPAPERHLQVDHPGQLVQFDCFCIGRLSGTKGTLWQYTAIDVASAYTWATLQVTRRNPSATWTSALARQVAADLAARGWRLERVMSDNASEFRSTTFQATIATLGARHSFIRVGGPRRTLCRAGPADHPGRVLKARLRPVSDPQTDRTAPRPGALPALLQHRTLPHWPMDPWPDSRGGSREGQAMAHKR